MDGHRYPCVPGGGIHHALGQLSRCNRRLVLQPRSCYGHCPGIRTHRRIHFLCAGNDTGWFVVVVPDTSTSLLHPEFQVEPITCLPVCLSTCTRLARLYLSFLLWRDRVDLFVHHPLLGTAPDRHPDPFWRRHPLALSKAGLLVDLPPRDVSLTHGHRGAEGHHLVDFTDADDRNSVLRHTAARRGGLLLRHKYSHYLRDDSPAGKRQP